MRLVGWEMLDCLGFEFEVEVLGSFGGLCIGEG